MTLFFISVAPASRRLSGRHPAFPFRLISTLLSIFLLLSAPLPAKTKASASPGTDRDYISALAAANRFLHAWQTQDHETGLLMLSDTAKHLTSEDRLNAFFSPGLAAQQAFEIGRGKKLKAGRYAFPVALFEIRGDRKWTHPRFSQLIVIRTGNEDWAVDKLP